MLVVAVVDLIVLRRAIQTLVLVIQDLLVRVEQVVQVDPHRVQVMQELLIEVVAVVQVVMLVLVLIVTGKRSFRYS